MRLWESSPRLCPDNRPLQQLAVLPDVLQGQEQRVLLDLFRLSLALIVLFLVLFGLISGLLLVLLGGHGHLEGLLRVAAFPGL